MCVCVCVANTRAFVISYHMFWYICYFFAYSLDKQRQTTNSNNSRGTPANALQSPGPETS